MLEGRTAVARIPAAAAVERVLSLIGSFRRIPWRLGYERPPPVSRKERRERRRSQAAPLRAALDRSCQKRIAATQVPQLPPLSAYSA
jgi:hypothetical protein